MWSEGGDAVTVDVNGVSRNNDCLVDNVRGRLGNGLTIELPSPRWPSASWVGDGLHEWRGERPFFPARGAPHPPLLVCNTDARLQKPGNLITLGVHQR